MSDWNLETEVHTAYLEKHMVWRRCLDCPDKFQSRTRVKSVSRTYNGVVVESCKIIKVAILVGPMQI